MDEVEELIAKLKGSDQKIRGDAAFALEKIKNPRAVPELVEVYLKDEDENVRKGAAWALRMIRDSVERCESTEHLAEFEQKLEEGFRKLKRSRKQENAEAGLEVAKLRMMAAKRRIELASDIGILLSEKPKPPKSGKGIYRAIRVMTNG